MSPNPSTTHQTLLSLCQAAREKLKQINGSLSELKSTMQRNKPLVPLTGDAADIPLWNRLLEEQWVAGEPPVWFEAPWLFVECYMYRRIREVMENRCVVLIG